MDGVQTSTSQRLTKPQLIRGVDMRSTEERQSLYLRTRPGVPTAFPGGSLTHDRKMEGPFYPFVNA